MADTEQTEQEARTPETEAPRPEGRILRSANPPKLKPRRPNVQSANPQGDRPRKDRAARAVNPAGTGSQGAAKVAEDPAVEIVRKAAAVRKVDAKVAEASVAIEVTTGVAAIEAASKARLKSISKN